MNTDVDYYEALQAEPGSSIEELKQQYRQLTELYQPSQNPNDRAFAEQQLRRINEAFVFLSDPTQKARYDQIHRQKLNKAGVWHRAGFATTSETPKTASRPRPDSHSARSAKSSNSVPIRPAKSGATITIGKFTLKRDWVVAGVAALALFIIVISVAMSLKPHHAYKMTDADLKRLIAKQHKNAAKSALETKAQAIAVQINRQERLAMMVRIKKLDPKAKLDNMTISQLIDYEAHVRAAHEIALAKK